MKSVITKFGDRPWRAPVAMSTSSLAGDAEASWACACDVGWTTSGETGAPRFACALGYAPDVKTLSVP